MSDTAPSAPTAQAAPTAPQAPVAPAAPPATPPAPAVPPAATPPAPPAPPAPAAPAGEPQDVASLPSWAQQLITNTRAEAAQWRTRAQGTAPAADPSTPPAPPAALAPQPAAEGDVARLPRWAQQAVTDGQGAARTLAVQTAVIAAAAGAGADISRLLDSASAMRTLAAVDPADTSAVTAAIQAAVTAQPYLAAGGFNPGRGGAEFGAPTGGEVTAQQFAAMDYAARSELFQTDPDTYRRLAG
ncbi:hypothetical protein OG864_29735 [Streptomyces sp. NBC_00124]|uniref:hypothetical protein n=1 Tax=Streptomyces sp. NBC_00124 TaxID=2975662 RepID=UPI00224F854E|nr:hypothetical protein [Streptomyces sp. NBC_00124]MCX5362883.1 hypothetical protein [Streptomyces sp. NBC_00124]